MFVARIADQIIGHSKIISNLVLAHQSNHLNSTFLFLGPEGVGRKIVALSLAQNISCEMGTKACGQCGPCVRVYRIFKDDHNLHYENSSSKKDSDSVTSQSESLLLIEPEGQSIKVEQARSVREFLHLQKVGKGRTVVIDSAHLLGIASANILLKTLEEPPEDTYFFLIAPSVRQVLPTIRSRSQVVQFGRLTDEQLEEVQAKKLGTSHSNKDWAIRAARGSVGKFLEFHNDEEQELNRLAMTFLKSSGYKDLDFFLNGEWRSVAKNRASALKLSYHISIWLRDIFFCQYNGAKDLVHAHAKQDVNELKEVLSNTYFKGFESIVKAESAIMGYVDPILSLETVWFECAGKEVNTRCG